MNIRLSKPYLGDKAEVIAALSEVLDSGFLTQGKYVAQFEKAVADYLGVKHAVAVSSGTAALHIALIAAGIKAHDEVIVPAYTFPATANVVELIGARPVFVDIDPETYNIDVAKIADAITKKTRAIMPVHLFGNPADMDAIMAIAAKKKIPVVEDAAGAIGSEYKRKKCGTIGMIGCFSFHPRKVIVTAEGGMVVTDDANLAAKARMLRNHGIESTPSGIDFLAAGFNYRMNELEAVLGCVQMKEIDKIVAERQALAKLYESRLSRIHSVKTQAIGHMSSTSWQAYVVRIAGKDPKDIIKALRDQGVEANIGTYALHLLKYYSEKYGYKPSDMPNALELFRTCVALPFYNGLNSESVAEVEAALKKYV